MINRTQLQVMKTMAEWLPGSWEELPDQSGYLLTRTAKATKQKREWWDTFLKVREGGYKAQSLLTEMRLTSQQRPTQFTPLDNPDPYRPDPNSQLT